jgi:hypothetical protein
VVEFYLIGEHFVRCVFSFFFLDKSKYIYKKAQRGATQRTQGVYKGSLRGRGEVREKPYMRIFYFLLKGKVR